MDPQEIRLALRRQPFVPFRLHLLDGTVFDFKHPDGLFMTRRTAYAAAQPVDDKVLPERAVVIAVLHISRLEESPVEKVTGNGTSP